MEQKITLFKEIASKEEIAAKLTTTDKLDEMLAILATNGLSLTADEFGEITKAIAEGNTDGELNESDLDNVSGGGWISVAIKVAYYCYQAYKVYKSIKG